MNFKSRNIISIKDFSKDDLLTILKTSKEIEDFPEKYTSLLKGKVMGTMFFEPSTRTRLSFESAMARLGGSITGFSDAGNTSAKKGESLCDTIKMMNAYTDVAVIRHPKDGSARLASTVATIPIINGGDGANQHPTQTCLDLYTISKEFPSLLDEEEPLKVCLAGDLRFGRTVHSLLSALVHFPVEFIMSAPKGLEMPSRYMNLAKEYNKKVKIATNLQEAVNECDVLYMTRLQEERFPDPVEFEHIKSAYKLKKKMLEGAKESMKIMHPLPRVNEIDTSVDATSHSCYFEQAANGVPVRQALLSLVLGAIE